MADILSASDIAQIKNIIENALAGARAQGDRAGRAAETERARQMAHALVKEELNLTVPQAFDELFKRLADNPVYPQDTAANLVAQPMVDPARFVDRGPFDDNSPEAIAERSRLELERRARGETPPDLGDGRTYPYRHDQLLTEDERVKKLNADLDANLAAADAKEDHAADLRRARVAPPEPAIAPKPEPEKHAKKK